jgi:hypothetical protein
MSLYDDVKKIDFHVLASIVIATTAAVSGGAIALFALFHVEPVEIDRYVSLKDLKDTYVLKSDHDKQVDALNKALHERAGEIQALDGCPASLQSWQTSQAEWKQATSNCHTALDQCNANCSITGEIRRVENQQNNLKYEMDNLSSPGHDGNPVGEISKTNQVKLEVDSQLANQFSARILELTKRLSCTQ